MEINREEKLELTKKEVKNKKLNAPVLDASSFKEEFYLSQES